MNWEGSRIRNGDVYPYVWDNLNYLERNRKTWCGPFSDHVSAWILCLVVCTCVGTPLHESNCTRWSGPLSRYSSKAVNSRRHPFIVWLDSPRRYLEELEQILGTCHDWAYFRISIRISSASSLQPFFPQILQNHSITHGQSWSYLSASYTGLDQRPVNKASKYMSKF